jgi:protein-tyrosine-phosphatase
LLRARLEERGADAEVDSAGLRVQGDQPPGVLLGFLHDWGVDIAPHVSRALSVDAITRADLVLTMEHYQVAEVMLVAADAWERTLTVRELVERGERIGKRSADEELANWLKRISAGRTRTDLVGAWHLDVADPLGQGSLAIQRTADELDDLVRRVADLIWPRRPRRG